LPVVRQQAKGKHLRLSGPFVAISALGLAVLAVSVIAVWTSINRVRAIDAIAATTTITVSVDTFAPPPADAAPAMTATQAWLQWAGGDQTTIPHGTTARLGLLPVLVGPYCGRECHGLIVRHGIAYSSLNRLAYGYSWPAFPHRHSHRMNWLFLDASDGQMINGCCSDHLEVPQCPRRNCHGRRQPIVTWQPHDLPTAMMAIGEVEQCP
jgi:prepilin-type processing-associated H-X9-DG protein